MVRREMSCERNSGKEERLLKDAQQGNCQLLCLQESHALSLWRVAELFKGLDSAHG